MFAFSVTFIPILRKTCFDFQMDHAILSIILSINFPNLTGKWQRAPVVSYRLARVFNSSISNLGLTWDRERLVLVGIFLLRMPLYHLLRFFRISELLFNRLLKLVADRTAVPGFCSVLPTKQTTQQLLVILVLISPYIYIMIFNFILALLDNVYCTIISV